MGKPKYTYNYDHDTDTTSIISVEKINGKVVTTTKTLEGNRTPQKSSVSSEVIFGMLAFLTITTLLEGV